MNRDPSISLIDATDEQIAAGEATLRTMPGAATAAAFFFEENSILELDDDGASLVYRTYELGKLLSADRPVNERQLIELPIELRAKVALRIPCLIDQART